LCEEGFDSRFKTSAVELHAATYLSGNGLYVVRPPCIITNQAGMVWNTCLAVHLLVQHRLENRSKMKRIQQHVSLHHQRRRYGICPIDSRLTDKGERASNSGCPSTSGVCFSAFSSTSHKGKRRCTGGSCGRLGTVPRESGPSGMAKKKFMQHPRYGHHMVTTRGSSRAGSEARLLRAA
jgi:hypothetical protein